MHLPKLILDFDALNSVLIMAVIKDGTEKIIQ